MLEIVEEFTKAPKAEKYVRESHRFVPLRGAALSPAEWMLARRLSGWRARALSRAQNHPESPSSPALPLPLSLSPCHRAGQSQHSSQRSLVPQLSQSLRRDQSCPEEPQEAKGLTELRLPGVYGHERDPCMRLPGSLHLASHPNFPIKFGKPRPAFSAS